MVTVPDLSAPVAAALLAYNKSKEDEPEFIAERLDHRDYGYVLTKNGLFAFCTEGVGSEAAITEDNKLNIDLYPRYSENSSSGMPVGSLELTDTELIMLPTLREVPLEEFIRTFGRRLDCNYNIWLDHFGMNKPMTKEHA